MKKRMKVPTDRSKRGNSRANAAHKGPTSIDPAIAKAKPGDVLVYSLGGIPLEATVAGSKVKCGNCQHGETFGASRVCRSLISPRAGFHHGPGYSCGYGKGA